MNQQKFHQIYYVTPWSFNLNSSAFVFNFSIILQIK